MLQPVKFVVAVSAQEAKQLAGSIGWDTWKEANEHLKQVKAPPTDPFYAAKYRVYRVVLVPPQPEPGTHPHSRVTAAP